MRETIQSMVKGMAGSMPYRCPLALPWSKRGFPSSCREADFSTADLLQALSVPQLIALALQSSATAAEGWVKLLLCFAGQEPPAGTAKICWCFSEFEDAFANRPDLFFHLRSSPLTRHKAHLGPEGVNVWEHCWEIMNRTRVWPLWALWHHIPTDGGSGSLWTVQSVSGTFAAEDWLLRELLLLSLWEEEEDQIALAEEPLAPEEQNQALPVLNRFPSKEENHSTAPTGFSYLLLFSPSDCNCGHHDCSFWSVIIPHYEQGHDFFQNFC